MISALDRKLLRDVWQMKGQTLAICLVIVLNPTLGRIRSTRQVTKRPTRMRRFHDLPKTGLARGTPEVLPGTSVDRRMIPPARAQNRSQRWQSYALRTALTKYAACAYERRG